MGDPSLPFSRFCHSYDYLVYQAWAFPASLEHNKATKYDVIRYVFISEINHIAGRAISYTRLRDCEAESRTTWEERRYGNKRTNALFNENYQALLSHFESRIPAIPAVPSQRRPLLSEKPLHRMKVSCLQNPGDISQDKSFRCLCCRRDLT